MVCSYGEQENLWYSRTIFGAFPLRNSIYPGYIELMPVNQADGLVVLDYGCGPGNDLVGFGHFSNPKKLIGADVSARNENSKKRTDLHGIEVGCKN